MRSGPYVEFSKEKRGSPGRFLRATRSVALQRFRSRLVVSLFARGDLHLQPVSRRWQRTCCVWVIGAGWVVSFIEVDLDVSVLRRISIKKARCLIGIFPAGEIARHNEQGARTIVFRVEAIFFTAERESYVTGKVGWPAIAKQVCNFNFARLGICDKTRIEAIRFVHRKPMETLKILAQLTVLVFHADCIALAAGMYKESQIANGETVFPGVRTKLHALNLLFS